MEQRHMAQGGPTMVRYLRYPDLVHLTLTPVDFCPQTHGRRESTSPGACLAVTERAGLVAHGGLLQASSTKSR